MRVLNIPIVVAWDEFKPGASFFVPCVYCLPVKQAIQEEVARLKLNVTIKQVVEHEQYGLRVWRNYDRLPPHSPPSKVKD